MIAFVTGIVVDIEENKLIIEQNGIGIQIFVPSNVTDRVSIGESIKIHTYMSVKEDDISLYGFLSKDDLKMYRLLLSVNGVGPKAAMGVLSALTADELRFAVLSDDAVSISKAPSIGKKTAQKMILELKDKLSLEEAFEQKIAKHNSGDVTVSVIHNDAVSEAIEALVALGYSSSESMRAVKQIEGSQDMTVEQILKASLKCL